MRETRKAYRVVEGTPPTCEEVTITITPKRIAVKDRYGLSYFEPDRFWIRYKGTVEDAWMRFLDEQRQERNALQERLAFTESQIMAGEAYFDTISPFKDPSPEDYQS